MATPPGHGEAAVASEVAFYPTGYVSHLGRTNRLGRLAWAIVSTCLYQLSPPPLNGYRRFLLTLFGAQLAPTAIIHPTARIWAPWNLSMGHRAALGPRVNCYNVAPVAIQADAVVSEGAFLCAASHDIHDAERPLVTGPITVGVGAWVFAEAFIGMNVTIGRGAVVGARGVVMRDVPPLAVVAGNPSVVVGTRRYGGC
jgi:putative colanic acid biosynthesis acetyltransferase WcaF